MFTTAAARPALAAALLLLLLLAPAAWGQDDLAQLRKENQALREQVAQLEQQVQQLQAKLTEQQQANADLKQLQLENEDLKVQKKNLIELAGLTPEGERVESRAALIQTSFDKKRGRTVVSTGNERLNITRGPAEDHFIALVYSYEGEKMQQKPDAITFFIQSPFSGGIYRGVDTMTLTIDGETVEVPVDDYQSVHKRAGLSKNRRTTDAETVRFLIPTDLLRKLARASKVEGKLGEMHFELTRDQIATFLAMRKRIEMGV